MTDLDVYQPSALGQYQAGIVMTPESAKAMDEQVRRCTEAVLREGTDYGVIPGTNGEKTLWRPGAQKLLQWFRLECICERIEVERDDEGRKHGITYRAEVGRGLKTATPVILATCEGTADYDESKFCQSEEQVKARLRDAEHKWAAKDRRVPNADRWNSAREYRADWNALMKRAQKRAIVGAVNDATAAGGIFTDREEDDHTPPPDGDGPSWYEQALERAADVTDPEDGNALYVEAADAHKKGWCNRKQQDTIQNILKKRARLLKKTAVVEVEDLARAAQGSPRTARGKAAGDGTRTRPRNADAPASAQDGTGDSGEPLPPPPGESGGADSLAPGEGEDPAEDQPGTAGKDQLTRLHTILTGLGFGGEDREQKLAIAEAITGHAPLTGPEDGRSSANLSFTEARRLIDTLDGFDGDRDALIAFMAALQAAAEDSAP